MDWRRFPTPFQPGIQGQYAFRPVYILPQGFEGLSSQFGNIVPAGTSFKEKPKGKRKKDPSVEERGQRKNRWRSHKKETCKCAVCKQSRGELQSTWKNHKKATCKCSVCKQARGESKSGKASVPVGSTSSTPTKSSSQLDVADSNTSLITGASGTRSGIERSPENVDPEDPVSDIDLLKSSKHESSVSVTPDCTISSNLSGAVTSRETDFFSDKKTEIIREVMSIDTVTTPVAISFQEASQVLVKRRRSLLSSVASISFEETSQILIKRRKSSMPPGYDKGEVVELLFRIDFMRRSAYLMLRALFLGSDRTILVGGAAGTRERDKQRSGLLMEAGGNAVILDSAQDNSVYQKEMISYAKKARPGIDVIGGNLASSNEARKLLWTLGTAGLRGGMGSCSIYAIPEVCPVGRGRVTAVYQTANVGSFAEIHIISDGRIFNRSHIVKRLIFGASTFVLGSFLSGTEEAPDNDFNQDERRLKSHRGMCLVEAQAKESHSRHLGAKPHVHMEIAEGVSTSVADKESLAQLIPFTLYPVPISSRHDSSVWMIVDREEETAVHEKYFPTAESIVSEEPEVVDVGQLHVFVEQEENKFQQKLKVVVDKSFDLMEHEETAFPEIYPQRSDTFVSDESDLVEVGQPQVFIEQEKEEFRQKLKIVLDKSFDLMELEQLEKSVSIRRPQMRLRESRQEVRHVAFGKEGLNYLEYYPDLARKLISADTPEDKLRLLRGFFFWIQHTCMSGAFIPWEDREDDDDSLQILAVNISPVQGGHKRPYAREKRPRNAMHMSLRPRQTSVTKNIRALKPKRGARKLSMSKVKAETNDDTNSPVVPQGQSDPRTATLGSKTARIKELQAQGPRREAIRVLEETSRSSLLEVLGSRDTRLS